MAYAAVLSLLQTLEQFQQRNPERVWGKTAEMLDSLHATAKYFQNVVEEARKIRSYDDDNHDVSEKIKSLEEKIRVATNEAEDVVELKIHQINKNLMLTLGAARKCFPHEDLIPVVEKMDTTKKQVMEILSGISTSTTRDANAAAAADDDGQILDTSDNPIANIEDGIVQGLDDDLEEIVKRLTGPPVSDLDIVAISGMGGIGKTTLARKAHDHIQIRYHFDIHVWITISQEFQSRSVLLDALHCISKKTNIVYEIDDKDKKKNSKLADLVQKSLKGRRYLFVVDDIWSIDVWDSIRGMFPNYNNGSRILLTTRENEVAMYGNSTSSPHEMNLLDLDNSWKLLRDKVFGLNHDHPPELEEIGKKIVKKCQGLPLTISVIAGHLSKMARTLASWKDVSRTLGKIVASHQDKCLGVLGLSYHHLPIHLKPCFLSMGSFPEDFEVETWRLIQLWIAEGFIRMSASGKTLEEIAVDYLEDLISRNLIIVRKRRFDGEIKTCAMHDLMREFCLKEANATRFMHVERAGGLVHSLPVAQYYNARRFCLQTQYSYEANDCCKQLPLVTRSIYSNRLVVGPSITRFNLLRVLTIFNRAFPSFPLEITKLFQLRYLSLICERLPFSISELQNLQTLIHDTMMNLRHFYGYTYYAPDTIWMMKNLRHIHLRRSSCLSGPRGENIQKTCRLSGMPNLEELNSLCSTSCTNKIFSGTPNLKRLIVFVTHYTSNKDDKYLIDMSILRKLEALKCLKKGASPDSINGFAFPTSLKRLTLAGEFRFPWEDISILVMLPNLEELKLKKFAISGEEWRLSDEDKFESLKLLLFNELDIQIWEASYDSFPNLKHLALKNCKYLKQIPIDFAEILTLESVELHDCGIAAEVSIREIVDEQVNLGNKPVKVYIDNTHSKSKSRHESQKT